MKRTKLLCLLCFCLLGLVLAAEADPPATLRTNLVIDLFILIGCFFILAAAIGVFRFPDFYVRLHASSKVVTLGGIGIFGGAALSFISVLAVQRVLLTAVFFLLTAPMAAYMIARAGYLQGLKPYEEADSVDEWQACGAAKETQD